jgi:hypothetical protein
VLFTARSARGPLGNGLYHALPTPDMPVIMGIGMGVGVDVHGGVGVDAGIGAGIGRRRCRCRRAPTSQYTRGQAKLACGYSLQ